MEREEKRARVGDNVEETKPATASDDSSRDLQNSIVEVSGQSNTDRHGESSRKRVKLDDDQTDVDSCHEASPDKDMLCQNEKILNSAELEDLEELHEVLKSPGACRE